MKRIHTKSESKREGFYMNINLEEREIINELQEKFAVNISKLFKLFLKSTLEKMEKTL